MVFFDFANNNINKVRTNKKEKMHKNVKGEIQTRGLMSYLLEFSLHYQMGYLLYLKYNMIKTYNSKMPGQNWGMTIVHI